MLAPACGNALMHRFRGDCQDRGKKNLICVEKGEVDNGIIF